MLGRRDHSRHELQQKLSERCKFLFPKKELTQSEIDELITKVLDYFAEEELQSDSKFAAAYTRQSVTKGWGPIKIGYKLRQKGVANHIIDAELKQDDEFWQEQISELIERKYTLPFKDINEQSQCQRFLTSRGFVFGQIINVLKEITKRK